jgi:hypothetical protein
MEGHRKRLNRCLVKKTDRHVRFCEMCDESYRCKLCDKTFDRKKTFETTSYHQIQKDLTRVDKGKANMIVDLGCPNSVLGVSDVETFISCLSQFQQEHLEMIDVDDNFKFGPSGPYKCSRKMKIPIGSEEATFWVTIAIVDAKIPMLLGNNIMKPLEAKIDLFSTGNGVLILDEEEIELKETGGGHYTIKVSDLGKLCRITNRFKCNRCDDELTSKNELETEKDARNQR